MKGSENIFSRKTLDIEDEEIDLKFRDKFTQNSMLLCINTQLLLLNQMFDVSLNALQSIQSVDPICWFNIVGPQIRRLYYIFVVSRSFVRKLDSEYC